uniref:WD_REPEATS_REGION domain-containing protein n=1 Tax=Rhodnius prolixus TaxID=13249 RepID=T1HY47_RHOPR
MDRVGAWRTDEDQFDFLFTNGNSVIIRNIDNPAMSDTYTEHSVPVNVAKYSPSGFYIASGDQSGRVRIWDTVNKEHLLKNEFQPIGGPIKDISWTPDSQRIVVVGEGRERFGHVFMAETGTSTISNISDVKKVRHRRGHGNYNWLATWNVRSLGKPGALKTLREELDKYGIEIAALQEIRWGKEGTFRAGEYS